MQRYEYLDIAKGIGILLVVWAHILISGASHRVIYAFHMPLFFLISGMLFRREKYSGVISFVKKRAKRLLLPFVIYSFFTWLIWAVFRFVRHDNIVSYWDPLLQTVIAKGSGAYIVHNSALWFIPCLFATEIIYFLISKFNNITKLVISTGCAAISFILGHLFGDDWWFLLPWNFDAALIAVFFYCVGNIFSERVNNSQLIEYSKRHLTVIVAVFTLSIAVLFWSALSFGECSMGSSSYQCNGAIFIARALVGCVACILMSILVSFVSSGNLIKNYFVREGKNSLDVMSIHIPVKGIVIMVLSVLCHVTGDFVSNSVMYSAIAFLLTMLIVDSLVSGIQYGKKYFTNLIQNNA